MNMDMVILFWSMMSAYINKDLQNGNFNFESLRLSITMYNSMWAIAGYYE
jgi:hypothetical protein